MGAVVLDGDFVNTGKVHLKMLLYCLISSVVDVQPHTHIFFLRNAKI